MLKRRNQNLNDLNNILTASFEALEFLKKKRYARTHTAALTFRMQIIPILIQKEESTQALHSINECYPFTKRRTYNHYILKMYEILALHDAGNFIRANTILKKVDLRKSKEKILYQRFKILKAYNQLFLRSETRFKVDNFLNEVSSFTEDKNGHNVSIIIVRLLFLLRRKKYGEFIDHIESISNYIHRYLRKAKLYRSELLFKILILLPKSNFHLEGFKRKSEPLIQKLKLKPIDLASQSGEFEVVQYEKLYLFMLDCLDNKFHYPRKS